MIKSIRVNKNIPMKMRDGVTLKADVYRPDDNNRYPAIIMRTPYNKDYRIRSGDFISIVDAAFAGYAVVTQDCRGRFASEGEWVPDRHESTDGYDTIEWVATESWCDGNVGMTGGSYLANVQWLAAIQNPPHLQAINPSVCQSSIYAQETRMSGGMPLELITSWLMLMAEDTVNKMERNGKDVSRWRELVRRARNYPEEVYSHLPLKDIPHFQIDGMYSTFKSWVSTNKHIDELPSEDSFFWQYEKVNVPCYHTGGWYDDYAGSGFKNFLGMREKGGTKRAREGQHILYGPWVHAATLPAYAGGIHFGPVASGAAAQVHEHHMAFFDKYLRGMDLKLPRVRYFVMGMNSWKTVDIWPLPQTKWMRIYFHSKGQANTLYGDGTLEWDEPSSEPPDVYLYDPRFPVHTLGGRTVPHGSLAPGPLDQTPVEKRKDVLCYTTPELSSDLEVTGPIVLHLFASTSVTDTDFMAKLIDVYPNGAAYNIAEGYIRAKYRESFIRSRPIEPGSIYEYNIDMATTSIMFRRGHRIRIDITSSNFPKIDRNMNTGNPFGEDSTGIPAMQTIYHQPEYASYIDLPVIPSTHTGKT